MHGDVRSCRAEGLGKLGCDGEGASDGAVAAARLVERPMRHHAMLRANDDLIEAIGWDPRATTFRRGWARHVSSRCRARVVLARLDCPLGSPEV
jgi:hypothetical protein